MNLIDTKEEQPAAKKLLMTSHVFVVTGFVCLAVWSLAPYFIPASFDLPLGQIDSVAVDQDLNVYIYLPFSYKVQKYDRNGKYLCGWYQDSGGYVEVMILKDDPEHLYLDYSGARATYSQDGEFIRLEMKEINEDDPAGEPLRNPTYETKLEDGTKYSIISRAFFPTIIKTAPDGAREISVAGSIFGYLVAGPLPGFIYLFIGGFQAAYHYEIYQGGYNKRFQASKKKSPTTDKH